MEADNCITKLASLKDAKDAVLPIGDEIVNFERVSSEAMDFCRGIVDVSAK